MLHIKTLIHSLGISDFTLNYNNNNTYTIYTLWCNYGDVRLNTLFNVNTLWCKTMVYLAPTFLTTHSQRY